MVCACDSNSTNSKCSWTVSENGIRPKSNWGQSNFQCFIFTVFDLLLMFTRFRFLNELLILMVNYIMSLLVLAIVMTDNGSMRFEFKSTVKQQLLKKFLPKVIPVNKFVYFCVKNLNKIVFNVLHCVMKWIFCENVFLFLQNFSWQ